MTTMRGAGGHEPAANGRHTHERSNARRARVTWSIADGRVAGAAAPLSVEPAHLSQRRPQGVVGERRVSDETIVAVADLLARRADDDQPFGLDHGEVGAAADDEPVPLPVGEEAVPTRVVGRWIRAAE